MLLKKGQSNGNVKILQYDLKILCFEPNGLDGTFDNGTYNAVCAYQRSRVYQQMVLCDLILGML